MRFRIGSSLLLVLMLSVLALPAVASGPTDADEGGPLHYKAWSLVYDEINGDRDVTIRLAPSRFFATEQVKTHGFVRLDLIGGTANIELAKLDRAVDVWLVDNKPGPGKSILPEEGDVVIHLGRLEPSADGSDVYLERDLGPETFRGVEVNWIFVSAADADPAQSRLLYATRSVFEQRYTRARLGREGFVELEVFPERPKGKGRPVQLPSEKSASILPPAPLPSPIIADEPHAILIEKGLVSKKVFVGGDIFFREEFEGNGRSCGTCHPPSNNQTIDKPFIASLPPSDPLFIAEQVPPWHPISQLERPALMREFGLILENVDGLESPNTKFLMRGVPHSLSMATSITAPPGNPNVQDHTGWSGDGAPSPGRLIEFLLGAIIQHYPKNSLARVFKEDVPSGYPFDFRMPSDFELGLTNEYMLNTGRLNELTLPAITLSDANAEAGRTRFIGSGCNGCHSNASANVASGLNLNFLTNVELVPNPAQGFMGIYFPLDGGFGGQGLAAPNRDCDNDGVLDCFGNGQFNSVGLIESADTPPFFHNNTAATVEDAVAFYQAPPFPNPLGFTPQEVDNVGAFLRVINAAFNFQMSIQRNKAALTIDPETQFVISLLDFNGIRGTANRLLLLSSDEIQDAVEVLTGSPLGVINPTAVYYAMMADKYNRAAINQTDLATRIRLMETATKLLHHANALLGTGVNFTLGSGNLLF